MMLYSLQHNIDMMMYTLHHHDIDTMMYTLYHHPSLTPLPLQPSKIDTSLQFYTYQIFDSFSDKMSLQLLSLSRNHGHMTSLITDNQNHKVVYTCQSPKPINKCLPHWHTNKYKHKLRMKFGANKKYFPEYFNFSQFSVNLQVIKVKCSLYHSIVCKHNYFTYWLEQHLNYISTFFYSYCISKNTNKNKKKCKKKLCLSLINNLNENDRMLTNAFCGGGHHQVSLNGDIVYKHLHHCMNTTLLDNEQYFKEKKFDFIGYKVFKLNFINDMDTTITKFYCKIPLDELTKYLNLKESRELSILHKIPLPHNLTKKTILTYFVNHFCDQCDLYVSILQEKNKKIRIKTKVRQKSNPVPSMAKFPPDPPSKTLIETILRGFCNDTKPKNITKAGYAVCGQLSSLNNMVLLKDLKCDLDIISPGNIGRHERLNKSNPIVPLNGPVLHS